MHQPRSTVARHAGRVGVLVIVCLGVGTSGSARVGEPPPEALEKPTPVASELELLQRDLAELDALMGSRLAPTEDTPAIGDHEGPPAAATSIADAGRRFEETGFAPVVALPTRRLVPFDHRVPTLTCIPTRACDLELETGESIDGHALGDPESWETAVLFEGEGERLRPHFLVKPSAFDLATNLVLVTNRRAYHVELVSPVESEARSASSRFDHRLGWWYPETWSKRRRAARQAEAERQAALRAASPAAVALDPAQLDWSYRVEHPWRRSRRLGWEPATIVDDGVRTWIRLPESRRPPEVPALFGVLRDGTLMPVNARVRDGWIVVPTVLDRAELVLGTGDRRRWLRIVYEGKGRAAGSLGAPEAGDE